MGGEYYLTISRIFAKMTAVIFYSESSVIVVNIFELSRYNNLSFLIFCSITTIFFNYSPLCSILFSF